MSEGNRKLFDVDFIPLVIRSRKAIVLLLMILLLLLLLMPLFCIIKTTKSFNRNKLLTRIEIRVLPNLLKFNFVVASVMGGVFFYIRFLLISSSVRFVHQLIQGWM